MFICDNGASALSEETIVVWTSDNGADPNYRMPAMDHDPLGTREKPEGPEHGVGIQPG
jgi:arylsulfatase A-like enzyme